MAGSGSRSGYLTVDEKKALDADMVPLIQKMIENKLNHRETNWISYQNLSPPKTPRTDRRLNLFLVGVGGAGKSALANLLYGDFSSDRQTFKSSASASAETLSPHYADSKFDDLNIRIIDTPGYYIEKLWDDFFRRRNVKNSEMILNEIEAIGGDLDVMIVVMNIANARTRELELKVLESVKMLKAETIKRTMMVATHAASTYGDAGVKRFLEDNNKNETMKKFLQDIDQRFVLVELPGENKNPKEVGTMVQSEVEKNQTRRMVMSMVGKVLSDTEHDGHYSMSQLVADVKKCFPAKSRVYTDHGEKSMADLCMGDKVLVSDQQGFVKYEDVIMFSHAIPDQESTFVTISTDSGKVLRLSPGHFVHVGELAQLRASQDVQVGDVVFTTDWKEEGKVEPARVSAITYEQLPGIYCPHTPSGSIIVDGVVASCYTDIMSPAAAHMAMYPVRLMYRVLPSDWFTWMLPYNTEQGMPSVLWNLKKAFTSMY